MRPQDVVGAGVTLGGIADPVVVDRDLRRHVRGPADSERLVVILQDVPRNGLEGRVETAVDLTVPEMAEAVVVDPDVMGGVHLHAVAIAATISTRLVLTLAVAV